MICTGRIRLNVHCRRPDELSSSRADDGTGEQGREAIRSRAAGKKDYGKIINENHYARLC